MRVIVNQLAALGLKTGVGHYTAQLLRCLREQTGGEDRIDVFPGVCVQRLRDLRARLHTHADGRGRNAQPGDGKSRPRISGVRATMRQWFRHCSQALMIRHFRAACSRHAYDLYHEPNFIPLPSDLPTVVTLHDLSVLLHPEWHPADRVTHFERHFRRGLARCDHYLAISEFGRQEIMRTFGIPPQRITRTYMGIRPGLGPLPSVGVAPVLHRLNLPSRYLLYLGTIEPRKNVLLLLRAYCSLPAPLRARWPLLLVGGWGWNFAETAAYLHAEARHRGVIHVGYVSEEDLPAIYNGARALVYPSLYEGFGLPPVEMMACGGAVLASTAGALVETVGCRAHLVSPEDLDGWRDALARVVEDDDWWRSLQRDVVAVARAFSWDRCAADTLRVYRNLCGAGTTDFQAAGGDAPVRRRAAG